MTTIGCGPDKSLFVDVDDNLWVCGMDLFNKQEYYKVPTMVEGLPPIHSVAAFGVILLLDVEGYVWKVQESELKKLTELPAIKSISSGNSHSLLLDVNGEVWGLGSNVHGQLGIDSGEIFDEKVYLPTKIQNVPAMQSICAAYNHSLLLDAEGRVWGSGTNADSRMGLNETPKTATVIDIDTKIHSFSAGWFHSLFLDVNHSVYTCGGNQMFQQGLDGHKIGKATKHTKLRGVRLVNGGQYHSMFVDMNDSVWICGRNFNGQLGTEPCPKLQLQQAEFFDSIPPIVSISSLFHSLFLDVEGNVWSCGKNVVGQLGLGCANDQVHIPTKIESMPRIKDPVARKMRAKSARNI